MSSLTVARSNAQLRAVSFHVSALVFVDQLRAERVRLVSSQAYRRLQANSAHGRQERVSAQGLRLRLSRAGTQVHSAKESASQRMGRNEALSEAPMPATSACCSRRRREARRKERNQTAESPQNEAKELREKASK